MPTPDETASLLSDTFAPIGDITVKAMFGGRGVFVDGTMFSLVDRAGQAFLRVGDANRQAFDEAGAEPHGRMPYASIPASVLADGDELLRWGRQAADVARSS